MDPEDKSLLGIYALLGLAMVCITVMFVAAVLS